MFIRYYSSSADVAGGHILFIQSVLHTEYRPVPSFFVLSCFSSTPDLKLLMYEIIHHLIIKGSRIEQGSHRRSKVDFSSISV